MSSAEPTVEPASAPDQPTTALPTASTSALPAAPAAPSTAPKPAGDASTPASTDAKAHPPSAVAQLMAENPTLSRSAAKKLLREQAWVAGKAERRAAEKAKNKAKAAEKRKLIDEGVLERPAKKGRQPPKTMYNARVVVDLGFDDLMIDKEVKSMAAQLAYCYSANRNSTARVPLLFTSFDKRLRDKLDGQPGQTHMLWKGVEWWEEDYTRLWKGKQVETGAETNVAATAEANATAATATEPAADATPASTSAPTPSASNSTPKPPVADPILLGSLSGKPRSTSAQSKVVYLTGDSPNVLSTLDEGTTYILGGIVDHNRYKNLCLDKASQHGVAHAQLPIGSFLPEMKTRKVLTVNQVFEIISEWVNQREKGGEAAWRAAFEKVIPLRKMDENHRTNKKLGKDGEEGEGEEEVYEAQEEGAVEGEVAAAVAEGVAAGASEAEVAASTEGEPAAADEARVPAA